LGTERESAASETPSAGCGCHASENERQEVFVGQTHPTVGVNNQYSGICNSSDKEATSFASGEAHRNPSQCSGVLPKRKQACDVSASWDLVISLLCCNCLSMQGLLLRKFILQVLTMQFDLL